VIDGCIQLLSATLIVVEVNPVGLQPPQRVLDLLDDPSAGVPALVGIIAHRHVRLAGQDNVLAPPADQGLADDLLGFPRRVDVGRVDEVDPASSVRWMMRMLSSWSLVPHSPNIIAPRHRLLTETPVFPRYRVCMGSP
jgi:hypothetical protein